MEVLEINKLNQDTGEKRRLEIANRIKKIRDDNKLSQEDFAEKISVSKSTIANVEQGKRELSSTVAINIAEKFDYTLDWIFGRSDIVKNRASDTIVTMVDVLKFSVVYKELLTSNREQLQWQFPRIVIDKMLLEFLLDVNHWEKLKSEDQISIEDCEVLIKSRKEKYNNSFDKDEKRESIKFVLVEEEHFAADNIKIDQMYGAYK